MTTNRKSFIYLHGSPGSPTDLSPEIRFNLASRFNFIADQRRGSTSLRDQASQVRRLMDDRGIHSSTLIAHSLGAGIALCFALQYPKRLDGVILISPWAFLRPTDKVSKLVPKLLQIPLLAKTLGAKAIRANLARSHFPRPVRSEALSALTEKYSAPEAITRILAEKNAFISEMRNQQNRWREIRCPVAIIAGPHDQITPFEFQAAPLQKEIPNSLLIQDPRVGHLASQIRPADFYSALNHIRIASEGEAYATN